jgi:hypothetical protein
MNPTSINLVLLGNLKYPIDVAALETWTSSILKIKHGDSVGHLPDAEGDEWEYTDEQLSKLLSADKNSDFTLGLINTPLEGNYYLRRLSDRVAVLSLHEMAEIVRYSEFTIEQYILRNAYELAVLFIANGKLIPSEYTTWAHDEVRGCLFDMNANKPDIVFSLHRPILCQACKTRVSSKQAPAALIPTLEHELRRIQKTLYVRMAEWVKSHPVAALLITAGSSVVLNFISSILFEKAKSAFPWLG